MVNKQAVLEFHSDIKDMVQNITAIHGRKTGDFVMMQCNVFALMRLWAEGARAHPEREKLSMMFALLIQNMAAAAVELAGLSEEATKAADNLLDVIGRKYKDMEERL